jgi:hypothetical protein
MKVRQKNDMSNYESRKFFSLYYYYYYVSTDGCVMQECNRRESHIFGGEESRQRRLNNILLPICKLLICKSALKTSIMIAINGTMMCIQKQKTNIIQSLILDRGKERERSIERAPGQHQRQNLCG